MDEQRKFFRIKNNGEILARFLSHSIKIIDISAASVLIVTNRHLPEHGTIEISIHLFSMNISYEILRANKSNMVLAFNNEEESNKLFVALKHLRDERRNQSPP